ncbi:DUF58 domain-containing protein [Bifidobacterium sp. BRDM6]|uniref:DUF58 domain-containing protein n=2 Tax=Bifidobacterium choloepi TaxID=2614131 RepID=A0A6I5MYU3_9BIFI|nr:DUF58 domain-containing protein [Bifidobacterium choloepi]
MTLPTVRRALGVVEGEHASRRPGGADDLLDIRQYESGDESRAIDWKISARSGRPMVVQRERLVSSHVYLLMDVGREMTEVCPSGERAFEVAANALCMFAALSLRRSDDISLVFGDAASITRVPFHGGFAQFEKTIDEALGRPWAAPRNIGALLDYAAHVRDRDALVVVATDEHALGPDHLKTIRRIARTHPLVVIDVTTINPFMPEPIRGAGPVHVADARTGRRVPAFLRTQADIAEVDTHRAYLAKALDAELARVDARAIRSDSSEAMFRAFVRLIASARPAATISSLSGGSR